MEKIEFADIVQVYLRTLPQAADVLQEIPEPQRSSFEAWPDGEVSDLFDFLPMAFMRPFLMPLLREEPADRATLTACVEFVEGLARNPDSYIQNALHFEVYEQFLEGREVLLRALRYLGPVAGDALRTMLEKNYPATLASLTEGQEDCR
ncbi:hypothetical protein EJ357_31450 [Streptomyces cyaneochromogenes]|uniref:Uncharacterized protein n=1 Tax=Streptomyces cyaneochromogenes TaxID=2496836 RepID=A0A3S9ME32_9ACTN|nr:hypothetical protein [Streptomyces cyaneochromogenes]AZQ37413.1 hypothetical protein EJ357_31450 [Streptomyces cyaneochromogenes]